ncbi:MAG: SdpI family protein [Minisyncoccia bacterium]|jgi:uncharacterized membrane protein
MNPRFVGTLLLIIVLACLATGIIVYPNLPTVFISHWNVAGHANGTMPTLWGVFFIPLLMLALVGLWTLLPRIDPIAPGFRGFRFVYDFFFFLVVSFLAYTYALMLGINLGWHVTMLKMILPALALLIFILGALLPHIKRNWFFGIRTPWTISNNVVWDKAHKLGGILFEITALFILASAFAPRAIVLWLILVPLIVAALTSVIYSYILFNRNINNPN